MSKYNVYIPVTIKELGLLTRSIDYIMNNLPARHIYLIGSSIIKSDNLFLMIKDRVSFLDEDLLYDGLTLNRIKKLIESKGGSQSKAGWYFQQFLKMSISFITNEPYIVWDSDTIPLNSINYYKDEKFYFTIKKEYNKPYFDTLSKITSPSLGKIYPFSFISENMIIIPNIMTKFIYEIMSIINLNGKYFYEKIIDAINIDCLNFAGFSEFESYGTYSLTYFSHNYEVRSLRTLREGIKFLGNRPTKQALLWASKDYDIISIERKDRVTIFAIISKLFFLRLFLKLKFVVNIRIFMRRLYRFLLKKSQVEFD